MESSHPVCVTFSNSLPPKVGPHTCIIILSWQLARNAEAQAYHRPTELDSVI